MGVVGLEDGFNALGDNIALLFQASAILELKDEVAKHFPHVVGEVLELLLRGCVHCFVSRHFSAPLLGLLVCFYVPNIHK